MLKIGLTGGIGVGKSTVAREFQKLGALFIDADEIARQSRAPGTPGFDQILARFKTTDRMELRQLISENPQAKKDLEAILHPLIKAQSDLELAQLMNQNPNAPCLVYEATLLIEANRAQDFDSVVVVTAPLHERVKRICARDHIDPSLAEKLIAAQSSDSFRLEHAHYEICNASTVSNLSEQVRKVLEQIISA